MILLLIIIINIYNYWLIGLIHIKSCLIYYLRLLFLLLALKLSNQPVSILLTLISSLIEDILPVYYWHIFQGADIVALNNEHSASNFDYIIDLQWVESATLSLSTKPQPCSVG